MGDAYKGLTIRIGADARPLNSAIDSIKRSARDAQKTLNRLKKASDLDPTDTRALQKSVELLGDKARHSATEMRTLSRAAEQAANKTVKFSTASEKFEGTIKEAAGRFKEIYSETQRVRSEIRRTDEQLETVYDSLKKIVAKGYGVSTKDAEKEVLRLRRAVSGTGDAAERARNEVKELLEFGFTSKQNKGLGLKMILGYDKGDLETLKLGWERLHEASSKLHKDQKALNEVEGFKKTEADIAAVRAELRGASYDYASFVAKLGSNAPSEGFRKASRSVELLDRAIERARSNTEKATAASRDLPKSFEAAAARMRAISTESTTIRSKIAAVEEKLRVIENTEGFSKLAASSERVYANLAKTEAEVSEMKYALDVARAKANDYAAELAQAEQHAKATDSELKEMRGHLASLNGEVSKYAGKLADAEKRLKDNSMAAEYREARAEVRSLNAELTRLNDMSTHTHMFGELGRSIRTAGYGLYSTLTPAIMIAGRYAVQAADDVDSAYRDMRKTVNGTEEEFEHLKDAAIEFSRAHITSAETILEIEAMGGQLGIAVGNLEAFATTVSNLDIATNMDADDISEQLGKMATVMDITVDEYDNFGDSLVRLGNNMPVMEGDIMNLTMRYMGMGKVVGMNANEMLGWSAAASATGQKAEAAGSAMQRFISNMESAVNGNADTLQAWANVAGMSAGEFKKAFEKDASNAMYAFVEGLGEMQKSGESVNQTLKALGINNVRDKQLLEGLANQMANGTKESNTLKDSLKMSADAWNGLSTVMKDGSVEKAGDAAREAEKKSEGFSGELGKLKNNAIALALELGDGLTPLMHAASGTFQELTAFVHALPPEMKTAAAGFGIAAAAAGPLMVGLGSVTTAVSQVSRIITKFPSGWIKASVGASTFTRALKAASDGMSLMRTEGMAFTQAASFMDGKVGNLGKAFMWLGRIAPAAFGGAAIIGALALQGEYEHKLEEHTRLLGKATESMKPAYSEWASSAENVDAMLNEVNGKVEREVLSLGELKKAVDDQLQSQADYADAVAERHQAVGDNIEMMEYWGSVIKELSGNVQKGTGQYEKYKTAIEEFNKIAGTSFKAVSEQNGALADERGNILNAKEAIDAYVESKKKALKLDALGEDYKEAIKEQQKAYETQQQAYDTFAQKQDAYNQVVKEAQADLANYTKGTQDYAAKQEEWNGKISDATREMESARTELDEISKASEAANERVASVEKTMDNVASGLANMSDYAAECGVPYGELAKKAEDAGVSLEQMQKTGTDTFARLYEACDGDMGRVKEQLDKLNDVNLDDIVLNVDVDKGELQILESTMVKLNGMQFDPKKLTIQEDGSVQLATDKLTEFDMKQLSNKKYTVTDDGTIANEDGKLLKLDSVTINNKKFWVTDDGTIMDENLKVKKLTKLSIGDKTYYVTSKGSVLDEKGKVEGLQQVISNITGKTYYITSDNTVYDESGKVTALNEAIHTVDGTSFAVTSNGTVMNEHGHVVNLVEEMKKIKDKKAKVSVATASAKSALADVIDKLGKITSKSVSVYVTTYEKKVQKATGAVSTSPIVPQFASGAIIPRHASGAINGIVTQPTLTNIGWVGEDGAEALIHMAHAGGAVVPLTNRRYVRPFAQAVASEMGGGGSSSVINNVTVQLTYDSTKEARQMARDITDELNSILAMGA